MLGNAGFLLGVASWLVMVVIQRAERADDCCPEQGAHQEYR